jgi:integrase
MMTATIDQPAGDVALADRHDHGKSKSHPRRENDNGKPPAHRKIRTVAQVLDFYLDHGIRDLCPRAQDDARHVLEVFADDYGAQRLTDCRAVDLMTWLQGHPEWSSEWTRRRIIATTKRAFNFAVETELIPRNPYDRFRCKGRIAFKRTPIDDDDLQTLLSFSAPCWRRFLLFLKFSGCRPGEAAALRWADVRLADSCCRLEAESHKTGKKTGQARIIPLVPTTIKLLLWMQVRRATSVAWLVVRLLRNGPVKARECSRFLSHYGCSDRAFFKARQKLGIIKRWVCGPQKEGCYYYQLPPDFDYARIEQPSDDHHVFTTCLGTPLNRTNISSYIRRTRERAGLERRVTCYGLRHRFGTNGVRNGAPLKLLSLAMGHKSVAMTEHYVSAAGLAEDVKKAALTICYGARANVVEIPPITSTSSAEKTPPLEQLPTRYCQGGPRRPYVPAKLADVKLPAMSADPEQETLEVMVRKIMATVRGHKRTYQPDRAKASTIAPPHEAAFKAVIWARAQDPGLVGKKDADVWRWLRQRRDCPFTVPKLLGTMQRYLSAAKAYNRAQTKQAI